VTALRSALFNLLFFGLTAVTAVICLPLMLFPPAAILRLSEFWTATTMRLLAAICGLSYEVRGTDFRPAGEPVIVAVKHQSAWETLAMPLLLPRPAYILKKELLRIPLFGWYLRRSGQIAIDRGGGAGALRAMAAEAKAALAAGRPVLIFPEGTRAAPGTTGSFHPGVAAPYMQLGVPVIPVALNSGLYWGRRAFHKRPGRIIVEFLPPIPPGLKPRDFLAELENRIATATARLEGEATGAVGRVE
jgi:1-acyl-sn-glycerol-3-phosphate acyltransferase